MDRPIIMLEEHFCYSAELLDRDVAQNPYTGLMKGIPALRERLLDADVLRLRAMDESNCTFQVLSHTPTVTDLNIEQCRAANDSMKSHIQRHPRRFGGFAVLPISSPAACAWELRRCVQTLGFAGALISSHTDTGGYFDGDEYFPMFETAQELDVPIYIHPTFPTAALADTQFDGTFSTYISSAIGSYTYGWHADVAIHLLRLFGSRLFDKLPRLKLIIGHMGETIPFMLERIITTSSRWGARRDFATVWAKNIWITTSGNWSIAPMACILRNTPIEHIMLSADYPFGTCSNAREFLTLLEASELVNDQQLNSIAFDNARKLLNLDVVDQLSHT